ncbi:MAG: methyl-accepting chemotaxis protein [Phormidesmis sp.]
MAIRILSQFSAFKLRKQLLLLLLLSTILPIVVLGAYGDRALSKLAASAVDNVEEETANEANSISVFLDSVKEDMRFLSHLYVLEGFLQAQNGGSQNGLDVDVWKEQLVGDITSLVENKQDYQQIRYIDEDGQEIIRVHRENDDPEQIRVVPSSALADASGLPYVQAALKLEPEKIHISEISLRRNLGQPLVAQGGIVHYSVPVFDQAGDRRGIVVVDLLFDQIVDLLKVGEGEDEVDFDAEESVFIINAEGDYLENPVDSGKEWGFDLGHDNNFQADYSEKTTQTILSSQRGVVEAGNDFAAYVQIDPNPEQDGEHFYVVEVQPRRAIYGAIDTFRNVELLVALLALATALPIGILRGRQLIGLVESLINNISTSSQQVFSTVSEQERIASQQSASVSETSTTMEELEASSRQSAEQATTAVEAAKTALARAEVGSQAVDETIAGMFTLDQKVEAIAQQIVKLSAQAGEIGSISQLMNDFASQTNMLALNSSVEAVRAGEHGKGFAVVANEIRKLSEQSQHSTEKISALVAEIQKLINTTVMVTEEGSKTAKAGVKVAKLTEQTFDDIKQGIDAVVVNNQQVSLTQKQQVEAIRQVVAAMESINHSSKESATGLSQTRIGTEQLYATANSLRSMI